jgi:hypothetical protein
MRVGGAAAAKGQHHAGALALVGVRFLADDAPGGAFPEGVKQSPGLMSQDRGDQLFSYQFTY